MDPISCEHESFQGTLDVNLRAKAARAVEARPKSADDGSVHSMGKPCLVGVQVMPTQAYNNQHSE